MDSNIERCSIRMKSLSGFGDDSETSFDQSSIKETQEFKVSEEHRENLVEQASKLLAEKHETIAKTQHLNKALIEYLLKKGITIRKLSTDEENEANENYEKLLERLYKLNKQKETLENEIIENKSVATEKKMKCLEDIDGLKAELFKIIAESETIIIASSPSQFSCKNFNHFMKTYEEMSAKRLEFITAQNNLMELKMKENEMNDLGDGFKVLDYLNLKTEVQTMSSRIDQKEEQLDKMRQRYNSEKHKLEAVKGKRESVNEMIEREMKRQVVVKGLENSLRDKIYQLKEEKNHLKDEYNELTEKSGILSQNGLMRDYDRINDEVENYLKRIFEIEAENMSLSQKT